MLSRRAALRTLVAALGGPALVARVPTQTRAFGIAYTSFAVRLLQGRDILRTDAARLTARSFFELCHRFGAAGGQVDLSQIQNSASLSDLRAWVAGHGLFVELSIPAQALESTETFDRAADVARALGTSRLRVALLSGRRYETFLTAEAWQSFATRWRATLSRIKPAVERHALHVGIENHKDWTAAELAALLRELDSPYVGACVDFGNNVAFLEDPMEVVTTLAPWAVTTHLKDMAVRRDDKGFELSEVPLGTGILPLADMIAALKRGRPDVNFCLEMITRDPLKVPYLEDAYWAPFGGRSAERIARFERTILSRASEAPLPRVSGLTPAEQLAAEDDNVRRSEAFARTVLHI
jgi:3-oxoisoapionate decarboxylase